MASNKTKTKRIFNGSQWTALSNFFEVHCISVTVIHNHHITRGTSLSFRLNSVQGTLFFGSASRSKHTSSLQVDEPKVQAADFPVFYRLRAVAAATLRSLV